MSNSVKYAVFSASNHQQLSQTTESYERALDWERWFTSADLGTTVVDEVEAA